MAEWAGKVEMSGIVEDFMIQEMIDAVYDSGIALQLRVAACEWLVASSHPFSRGLRDELVGRLNAEGAAAMKRLSE